MRGSQQPVVTTAGGRASQDRQASCAQGSVEVRLCVTASVRAIEHVWVGRGWGRIGLEYKDSALLSMFTQWKTGLQSPTPQPQQNTFVHDLQHVGKAIWSVGPHVVRGRHGRQQVLHTGHRWNTRGQGYLARGGWYTRSRAKKIIHARTQQQPQCYDAAHTGGWRSGGGTCTGVPWRFVYVSTGAAWPLAPTPHQTWESHADAFPVLEL